jgi:hypothetical protein
MDIENIRDKIRHKRYTISFSHTEKVRLRKIRLIEVESAILSGMIIEPRCMNGFEMLFLSREGPTGTCNNRLPMGGSPFRN